MKITNLKHYRILAGCCSERREESMTSPEKIARLVIQCLLSGEDRGCLPAEVSRRVRVAFIMCRAIEEDPLLQELGENDLEPDQALQIAVTIVRVVETARDENS